MRDDVMKPARMDRRQILTGALAGLALPSLAQAQQAGAVPVTAFRSFSVDVQRLVARGGGFSARLIARLLPPKVTDALAGHLDPGNTRAPTLLISVDTLYLTGFADAPSVEDFTHRDSMEGAAYVMAGRQVLSSTVLRASLPPSYSGAYYLPDIDQRRLDSLCLQFAGFLPQELNL